MKEKLILASSSPRRKDLLQSCGIPFEIVEHQFDEDSIFEKNPAKLVKILARGKAYSIASQSKYQDKYVLGVDTIVAFKNKILGKPKDKEEAEKYIKMLANNTHAVYSGVSLINVGKKVDVLEKSVSFVTFMPVDDRFIQFYLDNNLYKGYAGGYAIQGIFSLVVKKLKGSYTNIVGLPMELLYKILKDVNFISFN